MLAEAARKGFFDDSPIDAQAMNHKVTRRVGLSLLMALTLGAGIGAVAYWPSWVRQIDRPPAQIHFSDLSKVQIIGRTGVPLGELTTIIGFVTRANSSSFDVKVELDGGNTAEFFCEMRSYPAPPIPKKGNMVRVIGYETLEQRGTHESVARYWMTRDDMLTSLHGGEPRDLPSGDGKPRLITTFMVYDVPASLDPADGTAPE